MILFDLHCTDRHRFEAWFRDGTSFEKQRTAGTISCPVCGSTEVVKAPMAPHIAKSIGDAAPPSASQVDSVQPTEAESKLREGLEALRAHVESSCRYVGNDFAEEARRIHYGETDERNIYGEASDHEARDLEDEGIRFRRIPWLTRRHD